MIKLITKFVSDIRGSLLPTAALLIPIVVGGVALSVDYSRISSTKSGALEIADAAMMAGVLETKSLLKSGYSKVGAKDRGLELSRAFFEAHLQSLQGVNSIDFNPRIEYDDEIITGKSSIEADVVLTFAKVFGNETFEISIDNTVSVGGLSRTHFHFVVDISGSMAIGATLNDINMMKSSFNCAFACHRGHGRSVGSLRVEHVPRSPRGPPQVGKIQARSQPGALSLARRSTCRSHSL